MAIRRGAFRARGSRRISDWGVGPLARDLIIATTGTFLWTLGTTPSQNLTVVRTRGLVAVRLIGADAAGSGFFGAHGICMVNEDAFAAGAAAVPDPMTDANSDLWIWHSFFDVRQVTATIADGVNAVGNNSVIVIDSKAMRKDFDPEMVMVGVTEVIESTNATMEVTADCRQLFKV